MAEQPHASVPNEIARHLAHPSRRHVLSLVSEKEPCSVDELATSVAARETDGPPGDDQTHATAIELVHDHLPRLDDIGVIEYDRSHGEAELTETGERLLESMTAELLPSIG